MCIRDRYYIAVVLGSMGLILIGPELVLVMGGNDYAAASILLPPIVVGLLFQFTYGLYVNIEQYEKKTIPMSIGSMIAALLNIALNYIFIGKYGYVAAAYTTRCV